MFFFCAIFFRYMLSPTHQTASKYSSSSPSIQVTSEVKKNGTNSPATLKSKVHPTLVQHRAINHRKDRQRLRSIYCNCFWWCISCYSHGWLCKHWNGLIIVSLYFLFLVVFERQSSVQIHSPKAIQSSNHTSKVLL